MAQARGAARSIITSMNARFFSIEFHTRFFPGLILSRLRPREKNGASFPAALDSFVIFTVCVILAIVGVSNGVTHHSIFWWAAGAAGIAGILGLLVSSVWSNMGLKADYDNFLLGVFFFLVMLGLSSGIFIGSVRHSFLLGLFSSLAGLVSGYVLGIFAGLFFQHLGWMSTVLNFLSGLAIAGLAVIDLVLLFG